MKELTTALPCSPILCEVLSLVLALSRVQDPGSALGLVEVAPRPWAQA